MVNYENSRDKKSLELTILQKNYSFQHIQLIFKKVLK